MRKMCAVRQARSYYGPKTDSGEREIRYKKASQGGAGPAQFAWCLAVAWTALTKIKDAEEGLARVHCADLRLVCARRAFLVSARRCPGDGLVATVAPPVAMIAGAFAVPKLTLAGF